MTHSTGAIEGGLALKNTDLTVFYFPPDRTTVLCETGSGSDENRHPGPILSLVQHFIYSKKGYIFIGDYIATGEINTANCGIIYPH